MAISDEQYDKMAKKASPNSPLLKDCIKAFLVGGLICTFAQGITIVLTMSPLKTEEVKAVTLMIIVALTGILTGLGVFDTIGKHAGAGSFIPITGFANSIVSPALESQREGLILGTSCQMFSIAAPVLVFGCSSASVYGLIIYIFGWY